jgi:hypothetical protein
VRAILTTFTGILAAGVLGLLVTMIRDHFVLAELVTDVKQLVTEKDKAHTGINERLTYLERRELNDYRKRR